jgi:predicted kinase
MSVYEAKLIVLRGNSGSGKSTVAKKLREASHRKIAIVEQDYLRRFVLKEKENEGTDNLDLILQTTEFALSRGYDVILEGIFNFARYQRILAQLKDSCIDHYFYYFDISFEETLARHATKSNSHEFGEKEMREWHEPNDVTGFAGEQIISQAHSLQQTVAMIVRQTGL